jgi:peptide deformylase
MQHHPKVVTVPHQSLRRVAKPVVNLDKKIIQVIKHLKFNLKNHSKKGVGLSAPQINTQWRIYVTKPEFANQDPQQVQTNEAAIFINPQITKKSKTFELGEDNNETPLEGCLSIPGFYGPVPRYQWIELSYQTLNPTQNGLISRQIRLQDFSARLAQHEIDHLNGILFTDYTIEHNLPLYLENEHGKLISVADTKFIHSF